MPNIAYKLTISGEFESFDTAGCGYTIGISHTPYTVANGTANSALPIGGLANISVIYLKANQVLTYRLNSSSGTAITVSANQVFFGSGFDVSNVYVTNSSGNTASIYGFMAGA